MATNSVRTFRGSWADFTTQISNGTEYTVVIFHSQSCVTCRNIFAVISGLAAEFKQVQFVLVDADRSPDVLRSFKAFVLPAAKILRWSAGRLTEISSFVGSKEMNVRARLLALTRQDRQSAAGASL